MLTIDCPWCGPRDETEFGFGGEAHRTRPADPSALSDAEWAEFLFMRTNPKGLHRERWVHSHGCRRWFNVERHTVTNEITRVYQMGGASEATEAAPATETATIEKQGSRS
jgi:heterotetrameric sarcosine oxidase delta subunit